ncbi:alpha/beta hydrolase [Tenacibaculum agarivorans]|uniref:alpha/beta hydrolase n=1 Tax=Tenacibaculum agarivorans TaxID=1908389 RepID=UPI0009FA36E4|nr:alpha/beta hydrolase [Tenacibaculum agarivorans]
MKKVISFICLLTLNSLLFPMNAQQKTDTTLVYVHQEKASFKSKFFQSMASIFRVKKYIEKNITKHTYDQSIAPIPRSIRKNFIIHKDSLLKRQIFILEPKQNTSEKVILYLHGGAYYWNISKYNWSFAEELIKETSATIIIPDYPLAPSATCEDLYDFMNELYQQLISTHHHKNISIIGESAGGGLALGFSMLLRDQNTPQPHQLILLAPWLDVTMSNPEILKIDKKDKILGIKGLQLAGKGYAGKMNVTDYKVSPINGDLSNLPQTSIFIGTHDIFVADARRLKNKAHASGVPLRYYEYPKMFHIWILVKKLKEAKHARKQIVSLLLAKNSN